MPRSLARAAQKAGALLTTVALLVAGLSTAARAQSATGAKALVYCPLGVDVAGCDQIVTALTGSAAFPGGVDRAYDGSPGTVDIAYVTLSQYAVLVIPSLADDSTHSPYAVLRSAAVQSHLKAGLTGRVAVWAGTPDLGSDAATRAAKDQLLRNLASWGATDWSVAGTTGLVALADLSADAARRYDWLGGVSRLQLAADAELYGFDVATPKTGTGQQILKSGSTTTPYLAYTNMASFGLLLPSNATVGTVDAFGTADSSGTVVTRTLLVTAAGAGNTGAATIKTDKADYSVGEVVTFSGAGWTAGETVTITLHENPTIHADDIFTAVADSTGHIVNAQYSPEDTDDGMTYYVTAKGGTSGLIAQWTFTDGNKVTFSTTAGGTAITAFPNLTPNQCQAAFVQERQGGTLDTAATGGRSVSLSSAPAGDDFHATGNCGGPSVSSVTIAGGQSSAAFSFRIAAAGSYTVSGNGGFSGGNNASATVTVAPLTQSTSVSNVTATASTFGGTTNLSATVSPAGATGSVAFFVNGSTTPITATYNAVSGVATVTGYTHGLNASTTAYSVRAAFTGTGSFTNSEATNATALLVNKATATLTLDAASLSQTYTGTPRIVTVTTSPASLSGVAVTYAGSSTAPTAVGSYAIVASLNNTNYTATNATGTLVVGKALATIALSNLTATYDGTAKAATAVTTPAGLGVAIAYAQSGSPVASPTNAGSYDVTATIIDANYTGSQTGTLVIGKATATLAFDAPTLTQTYNGSPRVVTVTTTPSGLTGVAVTYDAGTTAPTNAGSYALTAALTNQNYQATPISGTLVVGKAAATIALTGLAQTYDGTPKLVGSTTTPTGLTVTYAYAQGGSPVAAPTNAGSYDVTATASNANYQGTQTGTLVIAPALPLLSALSSPTIHYGDATTTLSGTIATAGGLVPPGSVSITLGTGGSAATSSATIQSNGSFSASFNTAALTVPVSPYTIAYSFAAAGNFQGATGAGTLTVLKATQTLSFGALAGRTFGDADFTVGATSSAGLTPSFGASGNCTVSGATVHITGAGSCTITASQAGDANVEAATPVPQTFAIAKAGSVTLVTVSDAEYSGLPQGGTASVSGVGGLSQSLTVTYTGRNGTVYAASSTAPTNAGDYTASATFAGDANHDGSSNSANFSITRATLTITGPAATRAYGDANPDLGGTFSGAKNGESFTVGGTTTAGTTSPIGSYPIVPSASGATLANYNVVPVNGTLTVTRRSLTITASDRTKTYGQAVTFAGTEFVTSAGGLVNGDVVSGVSLTSTGAAATAGVAGSPYDIVASSATGTGLGNYDIHYVAGKLVVTKATPTVSATGAHVEYDAATHAAVVSATGALGEALTPLVVTYNGAADLPKNAGSYAVVATYTESANYLGGSATATITIDQKPLTITADDHTITYGDATPTLGVHYGAFAGGETPAVLGGTLSVVATGAPTTGLIPVPLAPDTFYPLVASGLTSSNYLITFQPGKLVVNQATPTVTITAATLGAFVFNGAAHVVTATAAGVGSPAESLTPVAIAYDLGGSALPGAPTNVGAYNVKASYAGSRNYKAAFSTGTFSITPATPTIQWGPLASIPQGTTLGATQLNATALGVDGTTPVAGSYAYTPPSGTLLTAVDPAKNLSVAFTSTDANYNGASKTVQIAVTNVSPTVAAIVAPLDPTPVTSAVQITTSFTDPGGTSDAPYAITINWGNNPLTGTPIVTTSSAGAPGPITASYTYPAAGIYTITVTVADKNGGTGSSTTTQYVVVYDPNGGFVTGGGWINSPTGAYAPMPTMTGKATFGFVSKYQNGASAPTGNTEFQFQAASFNFKSTSYEWLTISGARAQYKGSGTINGSGDYGFLLTAVDGSVSGGGGSDKFRMKVWNKSTNAIIYDNQMGLDDAGTPTTVLGGGSIVLHK